MGSPGARGRDEADHLAVAQGLDQLGPQRPEHRVRRPGLPRAARRRTGGAGAGAACSRTPARSRSYAALISAIRRAASSPPPRSGCQRFAWARYASVSSRSPAPVATPRIEYGSTHSL